MPDPLARLAVLVLAAVFAWAGLSKLVRPLAWREALDVYRLPNVAKRIAAGLVPLLEMAVPFLVLGASSRAGAALAIGLLAGASLMVLRARSFEGDVVPCGCFGATKARDYRALLGRNAVIGVVAAIVAMSPEDVVSGGGLLPNLDVVPIALVVAGAAAIWALVRVGGSLHRWRR
jgi:uncharacterized membrane protein YphA (DoxX/SURF4 family)